MKYRNFLRENLFLFYGVEEEKINQALLFDGITVKSALAGEILHNSHDSDKIGVIYKGKAIIKSGESDVIIKKASSGDLFGVASLFNKPDHLTYVSAVSNCTVICLSKEFIEKCIELDSGMAKNYITFLAKKIAFLNSKINSYTAKSAENKLYSYLLQLPRENNEITLNVNLSTIAKMIGVGRATLYRSFEKLELSGQITKNDKKIILNEV